MKNIPLFVFFLFILNVPKGYAFWNKVSEEQKYQCQQEASMQQNDFSAKQRYKSCVRAFKEINKLRKKELRDEKKKNFEPSDLWNPKRRKCKKILEDEYKEHMESLKLYGDPEIIQKKREEEEIKFKTIYLDWCIEDLEN